MHTGAWKLEHPASYQKSLLESNLKSSSGHYEKQSNKHLPLFISFEVSESVFGLFNKTE